MTHHISRRLANILLALVFLVSVVQIMPVSAQVKPPQPGLKPVVGYAVKHDLSAPLAEMAQRAQGAPVAERSARPALKLPKAARLGTASLLPESEAALPLPTAPVTAAMPAVLAGFEGVNNVDGMLPPDTNGDIGRDPATGKKWYMQWVNGSFNIWDVTNPAAPVKAYTVPKAGNSLWDGFGGDCEINNDGDPIVIFDQFANRWNASQFALNAFGPYFQCIAISQTADPTGAWYRYAFQVHTTKMNDYPKLAVWPDGYYMSVNQFTSSGSWAGAGAYVFERDKMLAGQTARFVYFDLFNANQAFGGMLPSDADGDIPPPTGAPNIFAEWDDSSWIQPTDALRLWEFHVDWEHTDNSTFGLNEQPNLVLNTLDVGIFKYDYIVPQPGTSVKLDQLADRLMHRLQYRNYGTYQALVTNHTVNVGTDEVSRAGVHWLELRKTTANWFIQNEGVHAPADGKHRWMASAALDASGNLALGYSISDGVSTYPSIAYAGRLATDPPNTLPQAEVMMKAGGGSQLSAYKRWGDYSMLSVDPQDDCTFWYTNEYLAVTSSADWKTWIGAFKYPSCANTVTGTLTGTVTASAGGAPIVGAKVSVNGSDVFTNASGVYSVNVTPGTYSVTASAFSYLSQTITGVVISGGSTTTRNFSLATAPSVTVTGTVSDASGHTGLPLYARIDIAGYPGGQVFTDPYTGTYTVQLYQGSAYPFTVNTVLGGYLTAQRLVTPAGPVNTENFGLTVDLTACSAPGYKFSGGVRETFDATSTPANWTVVDHMVPPNNQVWRFDDPAARGNLTGGTGNFAIIDSDYFGSGNSQNTSLVSPAMDFSGVSTVALSFKSNYIHGVADVADVDVSNDGGLTWNNVWRRTTTSVETVNLPISTWAANRSNVKVRFHYYNATWDWYWQVDDVVVGNPSCAAVAGGLVAGTVRDYNTLTSLVGASVSSSLETRTTFTTPLDSYLPDGFYQVFAPTGTQNLMAAMVGGYQSVTQSVDVWQNSVRPLNFSLPAGRLEFLPVSLAKTMDAGLSVTEPVSLKNTGSASATFALSEASGAPSMPVVTGPFADATRRVSPKQLDALTALSVRDYTPPIAPDWEGGSIVNTWQPGLLTPWGIGLARTGQVWVGSAALGGGDDLNHLYTTDGTPTGVTISTAEWDTAFAADMAYDLVSGNFWQVDVGGEGCIYEMDPVRQMFTGVRLCPQFPHGLRGLAFDSLNRTFYGGPWVDGIIYHFDLEGRLLDSKRTGINLSGMAINPMTGHLFVLSNAAIGRDAYVLDARNGYEVLGGFDIEGMTDFGQAGLEFSADGHLWAVDQLGAQVFEITSGESDIYAFADVGWLSLSPLSGSVAVGGAQAIGVTFNTAGLLPGVYLAHVPVAENTPYLTAPLALSLTVNPTYGVTLTAPVKYQKGLAGETLTYYLTVTNTGNMEDSYNISVSGNTWVVSAPSGVGPLAPFTSSSPLAVTIAIPEGIESGSNWVTISAASVSNPAKTASVTLIALVGTSQYLPLMNK